MSLEIRIIGQDNNPIIANMNLKNRKLKISNHEFFMGEYLNVIGPQEKYDKWILSYVYPLNRSGFVKECAKRILNVHNCKVELKEKFDFNEVYILDILLPRNSFIALSTYNIQ